MNLETKIRVILKCNLPEIKEEVIDTIVKRIMEEEGMEKACPSYVDTSNFTKDVEYIKEEYPYFKNFTNIEIGFKYRLFCEDRYGTSWMNPSTKLVSEFVHWYWLTKDFN